MNILVWVGVEVEVRPLVCNTPLLAQTRIARDEEAYTPSYKRHGSLNTSKSRMTLPKIRMETL